MNDLQVSVVFSSNPCSTDVTCSCRYEIVFMELFCIEYLNEWAILQDIPVPFAGNACHMPASPGCPCRSIRIFIADERLRGESVGDR